MIEMVKAKLNGKFEIIIPKHRADRPEWYSENGWERERLDSMFRALCKLDTIYYIGAEMGEMPALCQIWGAQVVLFEPNPKAWPSIREIWKANNLAHPAGIFSGFASDITKEASNPPEYADRMGIAQDGWPFCSKDEIIAAHGFKELDKESESYDQMKIDDFVKKTGILPTAISLDVEGAEGKVLRGALETLRNCRPIIWLSGHPEFLHDNFNGGGGFSYLRELREWLKNYFHYKEKLIAYDHEVHLIYHL